MALKEHPEAKAIQVAIRVGTPDTLAEAKRRIDDLVERYGTLAQVSVVLGTSTTSLTRWRKIASGELIKTTGLTQAGQTVSKALARGDRVTARRVLEHALLRGIDGARYSLGMSRRMLRSWIDLLEIELPRGRRTWSESTERLRTRLLDPRHSVSSAAREEIEDALLKHGSIFKAAAALEIAYRTLADWVQYYGLSAEGARRRLDLEHADTEVA